MGDRKLDIVGKGPTSCNLDGGVNVAEDLLTVNPDLNGIYAVCGPPAVGAIQSLKTPRSTSASSSWWVSTLLR